MKFTERMRESLGQQGPHVRVPTTPLAAVPGETLRFAVVLESGADPVVVEGFTVRLVEAHRQWLDGDDALIDHQGDSRPARDDVHPAWDRTVIAERTITRSLELAAHDRADLELELVIPEHCRPSAPACSHMLNIQVAIVGQIDPATNVRVDIESRASS